MKFAMPEREITNPTMATPRPALLCLWLAGRSVRSTHLVCLSLKNALAIALFSKFR